MEIVIGVVLLIGAFALGQTTADQETAERRTRLEGDQLVTSLRDGFAPQGCRYRVGGPVQRDLTLPYSRQRLNDRVCSTETKVALRND